MRFLLFITISIFPFHLGWSEIFTIDFEKQGGCSSVIVDRGIALTNKRGTICVSPESTNNVSNGSIQTNDLKGLQIVHIEGKSFTPISIDLAEYSLSLASTGTIVFTGRKANGDVVTFSYTLDNVRDGPGGENDFETIVFPSSFHDVLSVELPDKPFSADNLVIPASCLPLFLLG